MQISQGHDPEILHQMMNKRRRRDQKMEAKMQPKDSQAIRIIKVVTLKPSTTSSTEWPKKETRDRRWAITLTKPESVEAWGHQRI